MADTPSPMNPVGWFEIYVSDMARAKRFYETVFKQPLENMPMGPDSTDMQMCTFPMQAGASGSPGALVKHAQVKPGPGGTLVYFSCEDCAIEAGRATTAGGKLTLPKKGIGEYGFIALIQDTEGNMVGLHSRK